MYGIFIILVLSVVGGCTAIIGDRIGTRVGKKRLSLFGLRPKHTSVIVTAVTGVAIAMISLLVMALVSANVRTALFHLDDIQRNLKESKQELERVNKEVKRRERLSGILARQLESMLRQK